MLNSFRWDKECRVMALNFPQYRSFSCGGLIGFFGKLSGPRTRRIYEVRIYAPAALYPGVEPAVRVSPRPETHHWLADGRLCVKEVWDPMRGTFAGKLLTAVKYLRDFD